MKYDFDAILDRRSTGSLKWDRNHRFDMVSANEVINSLWVADMDFPCPEPVVSAIIERASHPVYGYTYFDNSGFFGLVSSWNEKRYGWKVDEGNILYAPGVVYAISCAVNALSRPGEGVLIQTPVYYPFKRIIESNGRMIIENPLVHDSNGYSMDFPGLEKLASSPDVKLMILCSPHNPVGRVWTEDELKKVSDICMRNEVLVLSDEIHADLIRQDMKFIPAAVAGNPQNTITFNAPSKSFNIPGLMASTVIFGNEDLKSAWKKEAYSKNGMSLPNPFGLTAGAAAYEKGEDWLNQVNAYIDENLKFIKQYIDSNIPSIKFDIPEGTYLAWLDFNGTQYSDDEALADLLYKKFGILVDPGNIFGESGKGFIRINAACPRSRLSDAFIEIKSLF